MLADDLILKSSAPSGGFFRPPVTEAEALRNLSWHCLLVLDPEYLERGSYPRAWPVLPSYDGNRFSEAKVAQHLAALVDAIQLVNPMGEVRWLPTRSSGDHYDASRLFRAVIGDLLKRQDPRAEAICSQVRRKLEEALARWPRAYCWYVSEVLSIVRDPGDLMANLGRAAAFSLTSAELELVQKTYAWAVTRLGEQRGLTKKAPLPQAPVALKRLGDTAASAAETGVLTQCQREVLATCTALGELFFDPHRPTVGGIQPLLFPLLIGPTGSGKTRIVQTLATRLGAHLIRITRGDFVPQGARLRPTAFVICDALLERERTVIFLDELDKYRAEGGPTPTTEWGAGVFGDLWNIADRRLPVENFLTEVDPARAQKPAITVEELRRRVQTRLFVVASGTFQSIWDSAARPKLGFRDSTGGAQAEISTEDVLRAQHISPEIVARFHSPLFLTYPPPAEVAQLLEASGVAGLARECGYRLTEQDCDLSRTGFRSIESLIATLLLTRHKQRQTGLGR